METYLAREIEGRHTRERNAMGGGVAASVGSTHLGGMRPQWCDRVFETHDLRRFAVSAT